MGAYCLQATMCCRLGSLEADLETDFGVSGITTYEGRGEETGLGRGRSQTTTQAPEALGHSGREFQCIVHECPCQAEKARPLSIATLLPRSSDSPGKGVTSAGVAL